MQPKYNVLVLLMLQLWTCVAVHCGAFEETTTLDN